jgi:hypothetical protein
VQRLDCLRNSLVVALIRSVSRRHSFDRYNFCMLLLSFNQSIRMDNVSYANELPDRSISVNIFTSTDDNNSCKLTSVRLLNGTCNHSKLGSVPKMQKMSEWSMFTIMPTNVISCNVG